MSKLDRFAVTVIRLPVLWGCLAALGFYAAIDQGILSGEFVQRYFASHPVEYVTMAMFFVGIAALVVKGLDVAMQFAMLGQISLGAKVAGGQKVEEVPALLHRLEEQGGSPNDNYFLRRLREALEYVQRKGSADTLDEHLRYAADLDVGRMQASYALVRIIIWAIPILGFLGTVVGITLAIAQLNGGDLDKSLPQMIGALKIAFDTTALALGLSMILMFAQFIADRFETQLLGQVDERTAAELVGRFEEYGAATDPQAASVRRMADAVIAATGQLVERQAELWRASIDTAHQQWTESTSAASAQLEETLLANTRRIEGALAGALATGLKQHADTLTAAEKELAQQQYARWQAVQQALTASTDALRGQQAEMLKQGEVLKEVLAATGEVRSLEQTLNDNLAALGASHNFEETVLSLSAAIQLLSTQLHGAGQGAARVELHAKKRPSANNAA